MLLEGLLDIIFRAFWGMLPGGGRQASYDQVLTDKEARKMPLW